MPAGGARRTLFEMSRANLGIPEETVRDLVAAHNALDEPMTDAQRSYLETLCREAGEDFDETLSKADASKRSDELRERSPRLAQE